MNRSKRHVIGKMIFEFIADFKASKIIDLNCFEEINLNLASKLIGEFIDILSIPFNFIIFWLKIQSKLNLNWIFLNFNWFWIWIWFGSIQKCILFTVVRYMEMDRYRDCLLDVISNVLFASLFEVIFRLYIRTVCWLFIDILLIIYNEINWFFKFKMKSLWSMMELSVQKCIFIRELVQKDFMLQKKLVKSLN